MTEQEYICEFCQKEFEDSRKLKFHKKRNVECLKKRGLSKQIYKCEFCTKEYTSKNALETHIKTKKCIVINLPLNDEINKLKQIILSKDNEIKTLRIQNDILMKIQQN